MKKNCQIMACFFAISFGGCIDYIDVENDIVLEDAINFSPSIDAKHLNPQPASLVDAAISVGKNCKGQAFTVPSIRDPNLKDPLHVLWFLDGKLALPQLTIEWEARDLAIMTLNVDRQFLLTHFENNLPKDFFERRHIIDFYVSDVKYTIPEALYIKNDKGLSDYAYWFVFFNNDPC